MGDCQPKRNLVPLFSSLIESLGGGRLFGRGKFAVVNEPLESYRIYDLPGKLLQLSDIASRTPLNLSPQNNIAEKFVHKALGQIFHFFHREFDYKLFEDQGCTITATVCYGRGHINTYWTGRRIVLGEGYFYPFTNFHLAYDVLAYELIHAWYYYARKRPKEYWRKLERYRSIWLMFLAYSLSSKGTRLY